jgi:hypothetical protein
MKIEEVLVIHYMDFRGEYGGILPIEDLIKGTYAKKLKINQKEYDIIMGYISHVDAKTNFYETVARLYIPKYKNNGEIIIDREARVKKGMDQYLMSPFYFLQLSYFMDYIKFKNGDKSGIPDYSRVRR